MELLLLYIFPLLVLLSAGFLILVAAFAAGLFYGRWYYDGSERTGARSSPWFRGLWLWPRLRRLYRWRVHDDDPENRHCYMDGGGATYLYICHPHGIVAWSTILTFVPWPRGTLGRAPPLIGVHWLPLALPFVRDIFLAAGCVDASREVLEQLVDKKRDEAGRDIVLIPGGTREMDPTPADRQTPSKRREGFLELAYARKGRVIIIPCIHKHENALYWLPAVNQWRLVAWLRSVSMRLTGYPFPTLFVGPLIPIHEKRRLETLFAPPHRYVPGETLEAYKARYWTILDMYWLNRS